jgi:hypothetical protein|tara:strand:- start:1709 stop:2590 length:882 start_codon:yes stop_codon:yes gene_type:complete
MVRKRPDLFTIFLDSTEKCTILHNFRPQSRRWGARGLYIYRAAEMKNFQTFVAWGDSHGDHVCRDSLAALQRHVKKFNPQHRIFLGDGFDFRALRQGIRNSESDAYDDLCSDLTQGYMMIEKLQPTVYLMGNHEHRLYRAAEENSNGLVRQYAKDGIKKLEGHLKKMGCRVLPYHYEKGVHLINKLAFVHGYTANANSVKQHAEIYAPSGGGVVMGHLHRIESVAAVRRGGARGYSGGCLADIPRLTYAAHRTATRRWENGWVFGLIGRKGFKIWQVEKLEGQWVMPSKILND